MKELIEIQHKLKAKKNQYNSFGKYAYRSCEDILEALKPLLDELKCFITLDDDIVLIGDRHYIKSTATIINSKEKTISVNAFAREGLVQKGMTESQITGSASSYARKYALNGLFAIDDTKDDDTRDNTKNQSPGYLEQLQNLIKKYNVDESMILTYFEKEKIEELNEDQQQKAIAMINKKYNKKEATNVQ